MTKTLQVALVGYNSMGRAHSNAWRQVKFCCPVKAAAAGKHVLCEKPLPTIG